MDTMCVDATTVRSATAVAHARETTRAFLEALRQPAVDSETADTAVLVVSEPVTNALRHGGGAYTLHLTAHPDTIEVAVDDPSPQAPRLRTPDLNGGTRGFGWPVLNRLESSGCDNCYALTLAKRLKAMGAAKYQNDGRAGPRRH
ncbi:ATP-binding protein [Streptomyces sp.]|uniref:ATP-binding protein n=1 Tax=Streptomyces sp. TaxID=1931 RepID=UPI002F3F2D7D